MVSSEQLAREAHPRPEVESTNTTNKIQQLIEAVEEDVKESEIAERVPDARESRAEDLQRIADLEGLVAHKENEMAQMASHQTQMKQEMSNREQNFTQTFGNGAASMNVQQGVMDWMLKGKKDKNKKPPARF